MSTIVGVKKKCILYFNINSWPADDESSGCPAASLVHVSNLSDSDSVGSLTDDLICFELSNYVKFTMEIVAMGGRNT